VETATTQTETCALNEPVALCSLPGAGSIGSVTATGTLTLRGTERPVTVDVDVLRTGERLVASGSIPTTWNDYGVEPPNLGFVTVDGAGSVDFLVTLEQN